MSRHTFNWFPVLDTDDLVFNSVIQPSGVARPGQFPLFLGCFLSLQVFQDCPEAPPPPKILATPSSHCQSS